MCLTNINILHKLRKSNSLFFLVWLLVFSKLVYIFLLLLSFVMIVTIISAIIYFRKKCKPSKILMCRLTNTTIEFSISIKEVFIVWYINDNSIYFINLISWSFGI